MQLRVYVSCPITLGDLNHNIEQAREATKKLMRANFSVYNPTLTCYLDSSTPVVSPGNFTHEEWISADSSWVSISDVILRLPGESKGADEETALAKELGIPIYYSVDELIATPPKVRQLIDLNRYGGDPRFINLLYEMAALHAKKQFDYCSKTDPFANIRGAVEYGISAWKGAILRINDKVQRLKSYCVKGTLANEGVEDTFLDLSIYALIALILHREERLKETK